MGVGDVFRDLKRSGDGRISDLDRQRAADRVKQLAAEGFIRGDDELKLRLRKIHGNHRRELEVAFEGLNAGADRLRGGGLRASDADRSDALRCLGMHESSGHLSADEATARRDLVAALKTPDDIARAFFYLPALPADSQQVERRISNRDREEARELLGEAHAEGRIDDAELVSAEALVGSARTRNELNGIPWALNSELGRRDENRFRRDEAECGRDEAGRRGGEKTREKASCEQRRHLRH